MKNTFHNADEAYDALLDEVVINGIELMARGQYLIAAFI